jgi:hypothetical protein
LTIAGLTREDFAGVEGFNTFWVFPQNWQAVSIFSRDLSTQWRLGFSGPSGLDYSAVMSVFRIRRVPRSQWEDLFDCLQIMEAARLNQLVELHEQKT